MKAVTLSPDESSSIRDRLEARRSWGDGTGADVAGLQLLQLLFLDSACDFPPDCQGPCNVVLMLWEETTRNATGVRIVVNGRELGILPGLDTVPGVNGVNILGVAAGSTTFRAEDIAGGTAEEATITVLDQQPFSDPQELKCESGGPADGGKCLMIASWKNGSPAPAGYDIFVDDAYQTTVSGQETQFLQDVDPGSHGVAVQGFLAESSVAFYYGCYLQTTCVIDCTDGPCDPPVALRLCQSEYDAASANVVRAQWMNGENPYGVGVNIYIDGTAAGTIPTDPAQGSPTLVFIGQLGVGDRRIGVQGNCEDPTIVSTVTEGTITLLDATPHTNPVKGDVTCSHDSTADPPSTTLSWETGDPSVFIDVYVRTGTELVYLGALGGGANSVTVTGTTEADRIELQFFAAIAGGFYGSAVVGCGPISSAKRYVPGLCNGLGTEFGGPQITSAIFGLSYLFLGGPAPPCAKACDANDDAKFDITDMVYVLNYLFLGGPAPPAWVDQDGDDSPDPTCLEAAPEDDCVTGHEFCSG